jgi:hypothetical protein
LRNSPRPTSQNSKIKSIYVPPTALEIQQTIRKDLNPPPLKTYKPSPVTKIPKESPQFLKKKKKKVKNNVRIPLFQKSRNRRSLPRFSTMSNQLIIKQHPLLLFWEAIIILIYLFFFKKNIYLSLQAVEQNHIPIFQRKPINQKKKASS